MPGFLIKSDSTDFFISITSSRVLGTDFYNSVDISNVVIRGRGNLIPYAISYEVGVVS